MVGQVFLGKYKTVRPLDQGGMSRSTSPGRRTPTAKSSSRCCKEQSLAQSKVREHFRREIHITSRFQHPHAVAYYRRRPQGAAQAPCWCMEYLRGIDLNLLLHRERRFTPERAGRLLAQLCDVLQAAHDAGHRPPRHQAGQPDDPLPRHAAGDAQADGLRPGQDGVAALHLAGRAVRLHAAAGRGHAGVHLAGAGARQRNGRPRRPLQRRRHAVRDADRPPAVRRADRRAS